MSADAASEKVVRLDCGVWSCGRCGPKKAKQYKHAIIRIAQREKLCRFLTVTLNPRKIEGEAVPYLRSVFAKWRTYLYRKFGKPITYIAVLEFHKTGVPHLHILVDRFIPQRWISASWKAVGGGGVVFIQYVNVHRVAGYLAKYLTKELLMSAPERSRRVTTSRSIHLLEKPKADRTWRLDHRSIFELLAIFSVVAGELRFDGEGFVSSFTCPAGSERPPWRNARGTISRQLAA